MRRLLPGIALLLLVAACASRVPTLSPTSAPSPTPTPIPSPWISCTPFALKTILIGDDPCLSAIAAFRVVAGAVGLPIARMVIEPEAFPCGSVWLGIGSPAICFGALIMPGTHMRGWVSFFGTDKVDAIALVRSYPFTGGPTATPPPWRATSLAFQVPPAGWVMPTS